MSLFPKRLTRCILGDEPLDPGSAYYSLLDEDGFRRDYCPSCWEKAEKSSSAHFWRGTIPSKKPKLLTQDQKALNLFKETQEPAKKFVLALYLQRKQQLIRRTQTLYELAETGEVFEIIPVSIHPDEGAELVRSLL